MWTIENKILERFEITQKRLVGTVAFFFIPVGSWVKEIDHGFVKFPKLIFFFKNKKQKMVGRLKQA